MWPSKRDYMDKLVGSRKYPYSYHKKGRGIKYVASRGRVWVFSGITHFSPVLSRDPGGLGSHVIAKLIFTVFNQCAEISAKLSQPG